MKILKTLFLSAAIALGCLVNTVPENASATNAAYEGYCIPGIASAKLKTKIVKGRFKKTSKRVAFANLYARSK